MGSVPRKSTSQTNLIEKPDYRFYISPTWTARPSVKRRGKLSSEKNTIGIWLLWEKAEERYKVLM